MTSPQPPEACAQEAELILLRSVFENARRLLRFNGVDRTKADQAYDALDASCEQVKLLDGNLLEDEDLLQITEGGPLIAVVLRICEAYEHGYGNGLHLNGKNNAAGELYQDPRQNLAYQLGYRKGAALSNRQGFSTPEAIRNEGDRSTFGHLILAEQLKQVTGAGDALAQA